MIARPSLERRIAGALDASPRRVPVVVGPCGSGRTSLLQALRDQWTPEACEYIDVERCATTPERFLTAITGPCPFAWPEPERRVAGPRAAIDAIIAFLALARGRTGDPVTFLLDGALELRTFESFPGLRSVVAELLQSVAASRNRFVLSSRYTARAERLVAEHPDAFVLVLVPPLAVDEVREALSTGRAAAFVPPADDLSYLARVVHALTDGRPAYVSALRDALIAMHEQGGGDPVSALASELGSEGRLASRCRQSYELRLHKARGYGALKAILDVLSEEQPLTLTEIAHRLGRTPGSTKDYLSWLEDVDLVAVAHKRYSFADPLLRLWARLNCRPSPPTEEQVAREVQVYALSRLPHAQPVAAGPSDPRRRMAV
jgi:hypothetical protein